MVNLFKIVDRIKSLKDIKTDKEFASRLGLSAPDFSKRKKSGTLLPLIINYGIAEKVNLDWLLTGEDEITKKGICVAEETPLYKVESLKGRVNKLEKEILEIQDKIKRCCRLENDDPELEAGCDLKKMKM
ncbi:MAG: hypothetical protein JRD05_00550 [Deltaproteobacteria bacterium]|nr:hypothetical protein [Deltaproteobacteria bacterium]